MKQLLIGIILIFGTWTCYAQLSDDHKSKLRALYGKINASPTPHSDPDIGSRIAELIKEGCLTGANRAVQQKTGYSHQQKAYAKSMMAATCGCISRSDDLKKGVIDSALLLKKQGTGSNEARQALLGGMNKAKQHCLMKVMMDMKAKQQSNINQRQGPL